MTRSRRSAGASGATLFRVIQNYFSILAGLGLRPAAWLCAFHPLTNRGSRLLCSTAGSLNFLGEIPHPFCFFFSLPRYPFLFCLAVLFLASKALLSFGVTLLKKGGQALVESRRDRRPSLFANRGPARSGSGGLLCRVEIENTATSVAVRGSGTVQTYTRLHN